MKRPSIRNILVPIDFSKMSIGAIKTARQLARRFHAIIHIAHVRRVDYATAFSAPSPPIAPFPLMTYDQDAEKRVLQELNGLACEHGISSASCHVVGGGPAATRPSYGEHYRDANAWAHRTEARFPWQHS